MTLYRATKRSHGFQRRLWEIGETVEIPDGAEQPPYHFERVDGEIRKGLPDEPVAVREREREARTLAESGRQPVIRTGMAANLPKPDESPFKRPEPAKQPVKETAREENPNREVHRGKPSR